MQYNQTKNHSMVSSKMTRTRSRISNGSAAFLDRIDGRSALGRRYRDILAELITHVGERPSAVSILICRRAATLALLCEQIESKMAEGERVNIVEFATASDVLSRLLRDCAPKSPG